MLAVSNVLGGLWQGYQQGREIKQHRKLSDEERDFQLEQRRVAEEERQQTKLLEQQNAAWQQLLQQRQQQQWNRDDSSYEQQLAQQGVMQAPISSKLRAFLAEIDSAKRTQLALDLTPDELRLAAQYPTAPAAIRQPSWFQMLPPALLPAAEEDIGNQPIEIAPREAISETVPDSPAAATVQNISWQGLPANLSDEVKAGAYKNLLARYFEEAPSAAEAAIYRGEKGRAEFPLINPFSGKYLRVKAAYQLEQPALGNFYHAGEGFRQKLANGQAELQNIPASGEIRKIILPAAGGVDEKEVTGIAYPQQADADSLLALAPAPGSKKPADKAAKIRQLMATYFAENQQANASEANEYYQWLQRLLPDDPEMELPIYLNNKPIMLPLSQVLKHPNLATPAPEELKMSVKVPETGEELSLTPAEAQAWYRARSSQLFNYTLPNGRTVALTGSELARLYPVMW